MPPLANVHPIVAWSHCGMHSENVGSSLVVKGEASEVNEGDVGGESGGRKLLLRFQVIAKWQFSAHCKASRYLKIITEKA
jgi:hypothetical protein